MKWIIMRSIITMVLPIFTLLAEESGIHFNIEIPNGPTIGMHQEGDRKLSVIIDGLLYRQAIESPVVGSLNQVAISSWVGGHYVAIIEIGDIQNHSYFCFTFKPNDGVFVYSGIGHIVTTAKKLNIQNLKKERGDSISASLITDAGAIFRYEHGCPNPPIFGTLTLIESGKGDISP